MNDNLYDLLVNMLVQNNIKFKVSLFHDVTYLKIVDWKIDLKFVDQEYRGFVLNHVPIYEDTASLESQNKTLIDTLYTAVNIIEECQRRS